MKKISREQAEQLLIDYNVIKSIINQNENELCVSMILSENKSCLIKVDIKTHKKTYFLEDIN